MLAFIHCLFFPAILPYEVMIQMEMLPSIFIVLKVFRLYKILDLYKMFKAVNLLPRALKITSIFLCIIVTLHWISLFNIALGIIDYNSNENFLNTYIKSLYWAVTTLTTVGYGDIVPQNNLSRVYTMLMMILGVASYGLIIGSISRMIIQADKHKQQKVEKFHDLKLLMEHYHIPIQLQQETYKYYQYLLSKKLSQDEHKIINSLPTNLQSEMKIYMKIKLIKDIPLFQKCHEKCLKLIAQKLVEKSYAPSDQIIQKGSIGYEMYIVAHGNVDIYINNQRISTLAKGEILGEIALIKQVQRSADAYASNYCELYALPKNDFDEICLEHPNLKDQIAQLTQPRYTLQSKKVA